MDNLQNILIPLIIFGSIFGIVYVAITAQNRENMAMIAAGMNPKVEKEKGYSKLRIALLAIFVPIGILVGNLTYGFFNIDPEPAAVVFSFLFGGISLTATYFIEEANKKNTNDYE